MDAEGSASKDLSLSFSFSFSLFILLSLSLCLSFFCALFLSLSLSCFSSVFSLYQLLSSLALPLKSLSILPIPLCLLQKYLFDIELCPLRWCPSLCGIWASALLLSSSLFTLNEAPSICVFLSDDSPPVM